MIGAEIARVELAHDEAVVVARQRARDVAELVGFDSLDQTRLATAVSELARNARRYGGGGQVRMLLTAEALEFEVADTGPGIADLDAILEGRYRSATGMGRGLIGVRLLMDDFAIDSGPGRGTRVRVAKRLPRGSPRVEPRALRDELLRRGAATPYDEVTRQNEELLRALGEVRARQEELLALNRELASTNRGVVALYAELDEQAEQLRDADERKSRFLADMSHELRTPLNSILALTELLLDGAPLGDEQALQIGYIRRTAQEELRLVGDLLDIARIEAGRLDLTVTDVSVEELFAVLRGQLRPLVGDRDVELHFDVAPGTGALLADEDKLMQILRNLITNAVKFTAHGEVLVTAEPDGEEVEFRVRDTGIGIAADDLGHVFEEFVQIPGELQVSRQGTGLGLPLARKLVEAMDGQIAMTSEAGVGTTVSVRLARAAGVAALPDLKGAVLIVDDDETARYILTTHLRDSPWPVRVATGGEMALTVLAGGTPEGVILDLTMPGVDGLEVLTRLRAQDNAVPVLIHTSRVLDPSERSRLESLGARIADKEATSRASLIATLSEMIGADA